MTLLLLVPFLLMTLMAALAVVAVPTQLAAEGVTLSRVMPAMVAYFLGALLGVVTLWAALAVRPAHWSVMALAGVAAACMLIGPLLWGRAIGEFHLSHHLIRGTALLASLGLLSVYVAAHR